MKTFSNKIALNLDGDREVSVKGFIAPIEYTQHNFHVKWDVLANLRAAKPEKQYPASVFQSFLPPTSVAVGALWQVEEEGVLALLRQLHPHPHLDMSSRGLWACLRAYNDDIAEVVFRIHATFNLAECHGNFVPDAGQFTPSQFAGTLMIDRLEEKVAFFQMHVPDGILNFAAIRKDAEDKSRYTADLGFCPHIELRAGTQTVLHDTEFTEAIPPAEAARALIVRFYKSQQINWVPLEEALVLAQAQQKPLHAISVNGPLADEAC